MTKRWGGAQSRQSNLRGLRPRYEHGHISAATLAAALRREADAVDAHNATAILHDGVRARWAKVWRKQADELDRLTHQGSSCDTRSYSSGWPLSERGETQRPGSS